MFCIRVRLCRITFRLISTRIADLQRILSADGLDDRQKNDLCIQPHAGMINIPQVQLDFVLMGQGAAAMRLGPARQAGFDGTALALTRRPQLILPRQQGARSDQRHISEKHVEQLRQFIETELPQESSDTGDSRVVVIRISR